MKRLIIIPGVLAAALVVAACTGSSPTSGQQAEQQSSNASQSIAEQTLPAPVFPYSEARFAFIQDEAAQALGSQTTSFIFQQGNPNPIMSCPSIGFPIANTAQLTNPQKPVTLTVPYQGGAAVTIGNMDPTQIYPPNASQGTYVLCVNRQGKPYTVYGEPNVVTVAGSASWVNGQIQESGAPTMPACKVSNPGTKQAKTTCTK